MLVRLSRCQGPLCAPKDIGDPGWQVAPPWPCYSEETGEAVVTASTVADRIVWRVLDGLEDSQEQTTSRAPRKKREREGTA